MLSNAFSLLIYGPTVERLFPRWGFWIVYTLGGAAASLGSLAWRSARHGGLESLSIGGSGAVFALGGAVLVASLRLRRIIPAGRARALGALRATIEAHETPDGVLYPSAAWIVTARRP